MDAVIETDEDGSVWLCSPEGREVWCHRLGTVEDVEEAFSQWLAERDQD